MVYILLIQVLRYMHKYIAQYIAQNEFYIIMCVYVCVDTRLFPQVQVSSMFLSNNACQ